jgi:hypothetical protein
LTILKPSVGRKSLTNSAVKHRKQLQDASVQEVIRLEKLVWRAAQRRDQAAFAKLVPADAIMIFQSGVVTQPDYLVTMRERTLSHYELRDVRGYMPNRRTVILLYHAIREGSFRGRRFPGGPVIESTIWVKRGRGWVAVLNQETPVKDAKQAHHRR